MERHERYTAQLVVEEIPGVTRVLSTGPVSEPSIRVAHIESLDGYKFDELQKKFKELKCLSFIVDLAPGRYTAVLDVHLIVEPA